MTKLPDYDLTWRLPLGRWKYVQPRRCRRVRQPLPWWALWLLGGPVPVAVALLIMWVMIHLRGGWILP